MTHFRLRAEDAAGRWIHVDGTFMPTFVDGVVDSLVTVFRDVDFQVEQDRAILRFRAIADVTPDIVGISDLSGSILYVNQAGKDFLGSDSDRLRRIDDFLEYVPLEYHHALVEDAMAAVRAGRPWEGDIDLIRTTSRWSTTASAIPRATRCCAGSRSAPAKAPEAPTWSAGWAGTSSSSSAAECRCATMSLRSPSRSSPV